MRDITDIIKGIWFYVSTQLVLTAATAKYQMLTKRVTLLPNNL